MKPIEALSKVIDAAIASTTLDGFRSKERQRPGFIVENMDTETRNALRGLSSQDSVNIRFQSWMVQK
jgi:hypothetical protein